MSSSDRPQHPRRRLSLYSHSTLGHDVSAALKASTPLSIRTTSLNFQETPAPPPSPVDFTFGSASTEAEKEQAEAWRFSSRSGQEGVVGA